MNRPGLPARRTHDYVRHGTTTLFAALEVATGKVTDACYPRHRHQEFLAFLRQVAKAYPRVKLHLVVDNYATHKHPKVASLAAVIDQQTPDVLALQEVGPDDVLDRLRDRLTHRLPHAAVGDPDGRGIRVALLSIRPLADPTKIRALPDDLRPVQVRDPAWDDPATPADEAAVREMGRGALAATVTIGGTSVTVVTAHLKSKLISYPRQTGVVSGSRFAPNDEGERLRYAGYAVNLRTAEAMTIRAHLDTILHNPTDPDDGSGREVAVVFAGDLNDEPEAASTQIVKGPGGSEIDLRPGSGFGRPDRGDGYRMWNLSPLLPTGPPANRRSRVCTRAAAS